MSTDLDALHASITGLVMALPRVLVALSLVPVTSRRSTGGLLRAAVALAMCLPLMPLLLAQAAAAPPQMTLWLLLLLKEAGLGLVIGFVVAIPFWVAEAVGFIIDNQRGAGVAAQADPLTDNETSPLGVLLHLGLVVTFLLLGGFELLLGLLYESYRIWPAGAWLPQWQPEAPAYFLGLLDRFMRLAVVVAGPAAVVMLLTELSLALVSLFAPQLQVFTLAMGVKSGVAMFVLAVYVVMLFEHLMPEVFAFKQALRELREVLQ